jgi:hypothetical protein
VGTTAIEAEAGVVGLGEDGVGWGQDEVAEEDFVAAFVDLRTIVSLAWPKQGRCGTRNLHMVLLGGGVEE